MGIPALNLVNHEDRSLSGLIRANVVARPASTPRLGFIANEVIQQVQAENAT
jgi:hypothetical protein